MKRLLMTAISILALFSWLWCSCGTKPEPPLPTSETYTFSSSGPDFAIDDFDSNLFNNEPSADNAGSSTGQTDSSDTNRDSGHLTADQTDSFNNSPESPIDEEVIDQSHSSLTATGGEIVLQNGTRLAVPAGALGETCSVNLAQIQNPRDFGTQATAYEIAGLPEMAEVTTLTFPAGEGISLQGIQVMNYNAVSQTYLEVPFNFNPASGTVTIEIKPAAAAQLRGQSPLAAILAPVQFFRQFISPDSSGAPPPVSNSRYIYEYQSEHEAARTRQEIPIPYYVQVGGACGSADVLMMLRAYMAADKQLTIGDVMQALYDPAGWSPETLQPGPFDDDFGFSVRKKIARLHDFVKSQTGLETRVGIFGKEQQIRWGLLEQLDKGRPVMLELTGIGHYVLVTGYRDSGQTFVIQDSKGIPSFDPNGNDEGMNAVRPWSWIWANMSSLGSSSLTWIVGTPPSGHTLQTLTCPAGGDTKANSEIGFIEFGKVNPRAAGHYTKDAVLRFRPSAAAGYVWWDPNSGKAVIVIPESATHLGLDIPVWNVSPNRVSQSVDITVTTNRARLFNDSRPVTSPAAADLTTARGKALLVIPLQDIRRLDLADPQGIQKITLDCALKDSGAFKDGFSVEAPISVVPHIEKLNPATGQPGDTIEIQGYTFGKSQSPLSAVRIGNTTALIKSWSDDKITIEVPATIGSGTQTLTVTSGDKYEYKSNAQDFGVGAVSPVNIVAEVPQLETGQVNITITGNCPGGSSILVGTVRRYDSVLGVHQVVVINPANISGFTLALTNPSPAQAELGSAYSAGEITVIKTWGAYTAIAAAYTDLKGQAATISCAGNSFKCDGILIDDNHGAIFTVSYEYSQIDKTDNDKESKVTEQIKVLLCTPKWDDEGKAYQSN
jgi:hypothetical protein